MQRHVLALHRQAMPAGSCHQAPTVSQRQGTSILLLWVKQAVQQLWQAVSYQQCRNEAEVLAGPCQSCRGRRQIVPAPAMEQQTQSQAGILPAATGSQGAHAGCQHSAAVEDRQQVLTAPMLSVQRQAAVPASSLSNSWL